MTTTTNLGMVHVEGDDNLVGGTGSESMMGKFNDAINNIDTHIGAVICTSGTRPSSPKAKMIIFETDTRLIYIRNASNTTWTLTNTGTPVVANTAAITAPFTNQIIYDSSFPGLKKYNGTSWEVAGGNERWIYKAASETVTSSTTVQNDNHFFWSVQSGAYALEGYVPFVGPTDGASSGGLKCDFTGPAGSTMYWTNFGENGAAGGGTLTDYNVVVQALSVARTMGTLTSGVAIMSFQPKGIIIVGGTSGTLQYRWAQGFASGTATEIIAGAWMKLTKIA